MATKLFTGWNIPFVPSDEDKSFELMIKATNTDKRHFEDLIKKTAEAIFMAKVWNTFYAAPGLI